MVVRGMSEGEMAGKNCQETAFWQSRQASCKGPLDASLWETSPAAVACYNPLGNF